ncbi:hypothetical protein RRG08_053007 [Elysia crispata]|uniref:Uncharacterized protein n=1 Tax=Elysia crispata TaxID=231223 RepID=A0AAE0Z131_9GAST|nr:hypothetical protein RRG08_053007 [Elysia crispata]
MSTPVYLVQTCMISSQAFGQSSWKMLFTGRESGDNWGSRGAMPAGVGDQGPPTNSKATKSFKNTNFTKP